MKFTATEQEIAQIAANAVNASKPMGMGFLHYREISYDASQFEGVISDQGLYVDYHDGRMVKLSIRRSGDGWEINDNISADYESWIATYPTVAALVQSVIPGAAAA